MLAAKTYRSDDISDVGALGDEVRPLVNHGVVDYVHIIVLAIGW